MPGGVRERPNRHDWKSCVGQPTVGSNPTSSAMSLDTRPRARRLLRARRCAGRWTRRARPPGTATCRSGAVALVGGAGHRRPPQRARAAGRPDRPRRAAGPAPTPRPALGQLAPRRRHPGGHPRALPHVRRGAGGRPGGPRLVFGAADPKAGACGSLYNLCCDPRLNHEVAVTPGVLAAECGEVLVAFFAERRGPRGPENPGQRDPVASRPEGCESGRIGRSRKPLCSFGYRGFESHSLRGSAGRRIE